MKEEFKIKKKTLAIFSISVILLIFIMLSIFRSSVSVEDQASTNLGGLSLEAKFEILSSANTNFCAGPNILEMAESERLQGSCCSAMDFHRYEEQVEGLKEFSYISEIPKDPYDISAEWADKYIDYFEETTLTSEQQKIYDEAAQLSHEGGPCCCKCWRWYAYGGLAKYLIIEHDFTSEQVAEVWNLSDGCGGSGYIEGGGGHGH